MNLSISKPAVHAVRNKGQVWTPRWVADAMAILLNGSDRSEVLDPAVGPGILLASCRDLGILASSRAYEIDTDVLSDFHASESFKSSEIANLRIENFIESKEQFHVDAVIANPPYLRHHKIPSEIKSRCQELVLEELSIRLDARAGLHIFFLVKSLSHLKPNGRLVFLLPADTFEGIFAKSLWTAIALYYKVEGVITFSEEVAAFPGVDTNAVIVIISKKLPNEEMVWARWRGGDPKDFAPAAHAAFIQGDPGRASTLGLESHTVKLNKAVSRGFTRSQTVPDVEGVRFSDMAKVVRGIATGSNDYFTFTKHRLIQEGLDERDFVRSVARVKDVPGETLRVEDLRSLDASGRPTYLLSIDSETKMTEELQRYLIRGEKDGENSGALVRARKVWYYMEKRESVPILFAYLGRRKTRFIRSFVEISPLTGFLCVYPLEGVDTDRLCETLNHPSTISELAKVGKSYGNGAIKVEPGGLRNLIVPFEAIKSSGLKIGATCN